MTTTAQPNTQPSQRLLPPAALAILAAAMFFTGISWGLPSRTTDPYLFGSRTPWTGNQILTLAGDWDDAADRGADIAMHPLLRGDQPIVVNATDAQRAAIVRRFRLYSDQPDEMITFRALSRMKPIRGDLDPHFFQYGGLWVYPVGALLKAASLLHLVMLRGDLAFYLDHPQAFGRFYLVARAYSAVWGIAGVLVVYALMMEWTAKRFAAIVASLLYCTMPVVVNAAHEAKPHLAGGVLTLLTVLLAMRFVRGGRKHIAILAGISAGAAAAMVLTGAVAFSILPVMAVLGASRWTDRARLAAWSIAAGVAVFLLTNPYLPIDLAFHRSVVQSNVGNYGNFYHPAFSLADAWTAMRLIGIGMSPFAAAAGAAASVLILMRLRTASERRLLLLIAPALIVGLQFVLLCSGKPAEYARFALMLDTAMAMALAAVVSRAKPRMLAAALGLAAMLSSTVMGLRYVRNFRVDCTPYGTRDVAAATLAKLQHPNATLSIWAEPAPYAMPPVDLFQWRLLLLPRDVTTKDAAADVSVRATDSWQPTPPNRYPVEGVRQWGTSPISWANKPFDIDWVAANSPYNPAK